jgi:GNAT superfamily N-acetyltransferase
MSTSAEHVEVAVGVLPDDTPVVLRALPYADPRAQELIEKVQLEYVARYGGRDAAVVHPDEFAPPRGMFLVAEVDGVAAGCGAWRAVAAETAEIKRVYVEPAFRRRGIAQVVVRTLERAAARAGHRSVVLNTGRQQPEAVALYEAMGYVPVAGYGPYACAKDAIFLGKDLPAVSGEEGRPWAS